MIATLYMELRESYDDPNVIYKYLVGLGTDELNAACERFNHPELKDSLVITIDEDTKLRVTVITDLNLSDNQLIQGVLEVVSQQAELAFPSRPISAPNKRVEA